MRNLSKILTTLLSLSTCVFARGSVTEDCFYYREICQKASVDDYFFKNFRSMSEFRSAIELEEGKKFAEYARSSKNILTHLELCRSLEGIGNPILTDFPVIGKFSPTTVRYMVLADQIQKLCKVPTKATIVEIGGGYGGQAFILSRFIPFNKYYIYELPEVAALANRVSEALAMENTFCLPIRRHLFEEKIDLVISNYAFSEMERKKQLDYFERVIRKAERGFIVYNQISKEHKIDSMSPEEFVNLLRAHGMNTKIMKEFPSSSPDNFLIYWVKK